MSIGGKAFQLLNLVGQLLNGLSTGVLIMSLEAIKVCLCSVSQWWNLREGYLLVKTF